MEDRAGEILEKLKSFLNQDRDIKSWGIYEFLKNKIESFRNIIPLINDLRSDALRERHWKQLKMEIVEDFDEKGDDFTLEKVISLNLDRHAKQISELAENALKELRIEKQLDKIEYTWDHDPITDITTDIVPSKNSEQKFYKITQTDNLYNIIEEHMVILSNTKSGAFYRQFAQ